MADDAREREIENLEIEALNKLCHVFHVGKNHAISSKAFNETEPFKNDAQLIWRRMIAMGAIEEVSRSVSSTRFIVSANIVKIADARKAEIVTRHQQPDRVAAAESWMRQHPRWSIAFIAFVGLAAFVTLLNQLIQLYDRFVK